jgi:hypothetical protein
LPKATGLAASLQARFGDAVHTTVTPGKRGQFDVIAGDRTLFSKHVVHRFPDPGEVEDAVAALLDP